MREYGKSGIYHILCRSTGQRYIGGSTDVSNRYAHHRFHLRRNSHKCKSLQEIWNKFGEENFSFQRIEECERDQSVVRELEQEYLDAEPEETLLNGREVSGGKGNPAGSLKAREVALKAWKTKRKKILKKG